MAEPFPTAAGPTAAAVEKDTAEAPVVENTPTEASAGEASPQPVVDTNVATNSSCSLQEATPVPIGTSAVQAEKDALLVGTGVTAQSVDMSAAAEAADTDAGHALASEHSEQLLAEAAHTVAVAAPDTVPGEQAAEPAPMANASHTASSTQSVTQELAPPNAAEVRQEQPAAEAEGRPAALGAHKPASAKVARPASAKAEPAVAAPAKVAEPVHTAVTEQHSETVKTHSETTVERLTTPTAMRMLKTLEQTQGDKTDWHIATGVVFKGTKLDSNEMAAMVDRLCVAKHHEDNMPPKAHAVKLVYEGSQETYVPVKEVTKGESISYMSELYSRCQQTRAKTQQQLAEKYLQPLVHPKAPGRKTATAKPVAK